MSRRRASGLGRHSLLRLALVVVVAGCGGGAGQDAAVVTDDGGLDAAPSCTTDLDCDDGLACDGDERCSGGRCVAGEPIACDDGVACTTDFCSEELRRCVNRALDADGDGVVAATCLDARGMPLGDDCDDTNAAIQPGAQELCDPMGVDEDCDPTTLGGRDGDGDGYIDRACCNGTDCGTDCNDAVRGANPSGTEACNGIDDDCDGNIDEGMLVTVYRDVDGDGHGDPTISLMACPGRAGYVDLGDDCDDTNAARSPTLPEVCDTIDNDCDGVPDPMDTPIVTLWYADGDGDGFGDAARAIESCAPPGAGYSLLGTDCDDVDPARHPGQAEACNGRDDDCNGIADYEIAPGDTEDDDLDGRPDARCEPRPANPDCDDRDASTSGDSAEVCDGRDNDCDGRTDEGVTSTTYYRDEDGDGYGSESAGAIVGCGVVPGYVIRAGDCDDRNALRNPGTLEGCNGSDDDCDALIDEEPANAGCSPTQTCSAGRCRERPPGCADGYADCDGVQSNGCEARLDSDASNCGVCGRYCPTEPGAASSCVASRCAPIACVPGRLDCNANLGTGRDGCEHVAACGACGTTPGPEICGNGLDDDCDGMLDEGCTCTAGGRCTTSCGSAGTLACTSGVATCAPPAETCNGTDDDCDGLRDEGCCTAGAACTTSCGSMGVASCGAMATPLSCTPPMETCNGRDDDCDGRTDEGMAALSCGMGACARTAPACVAGVAGVCTPGMPTTETCNAIDDDCNGVVDDGFGMPMVCGVGACQRSVPSCGMGMTPMCTPGAPATEVCNGIDDDCDTRTDEGFGTITCGTGVCGRVVPACLMGVPQTCVPGMPGTESCNGMDDDCDTRTDEALGSTPCGTGACARTTQNCIGGVLQTCVPGMPGTEVCNAIDDDCDMSTDEALAPVTCGLGACFRSQPSCVGGTPRMCMPGAPSMELCNSVDDDCNGTADNTCPLGIATGGRASGPIFGLVSFGSFVLDCAAGQAIVGAQMNTGGLLDRIEARCQPIQLSVNTATSPDYSYTIAYSGAITSPGAFGGTGGGTQPAADCPAGWIAYGIAGRAGDDMDGFNLLCAPVSLTRSGPTWVPTVNTGMAMPTTYWGSAGGTAFSFECPSNQVLVGLEGETNPSFGAGGVAGAVGARCAPILVTSM